MASNRERQRALARAKAERQSARRTQTARRRRQWKAGITGAVALVVLVTGSLWLGGAFEPTPGTVASCTWTAPTDNTNGDLKNVGTPPTEVPSVGSRNMKITTNHGTVEVALDLKHAPCAGASFTYLASKKFFDNTPCHKLLTYGTYALECGDPAGSDKGGPFYTFADENVPAPSPSATEPSASQSAAPSASASPDATPSPSASAPSTKYVRGAVVLVHSQPNLNGSAFYILYQDSPDLGTQYPVIGYVTKGIEVVDQVAAGGVEQIGGQDAIGGKPKTETKVQSLSVGDQRDQAATPAKLPPRAVSSSSAASPPDSAAPTATASPSADAASAPATSPPSASTTAAIP